MVRRALRCFVKVLRERIQSHFGGTTLTMSACWTDRDVSILRAIGIVNKILHATGILGSGLPATYCDSAGVPATRIAATRLVMLALRTQLLKGVDSMAADASSNNEHMVFERLANALRSGEDNEAVIFSSVEMLMEAVQRHAAEALYNLQRLEMYMGIS